MQCPTNVQSLGSNVGSDTKPIKIVNGQAVAVTNTLVDTTSNQVIGGYKTFATNIQTRSANAIGTADYPYSVVQNDKNDTFLYGMRCAVATNGKVDPYITARNADGTTRDFTIESPLSPEVSLGNGFYMRRWGYFVQITAFNATGSGGVNASPLTNLPVCASYAVTTVFGQNADYAGAAWIQTNTTTMTWNCTAGIQKYMTLIYLTTSFYTG